MAAAKSRSFWPKTLGPWVHLLAPIITGLAIARPTVVAAFLAASALCLFLAREPAGLMLGYWGQQARKDEGWRAQRWVRAFVGVGFVLLVVAFVIGDIRVKLSIGGPCVLWILLGVLTVRHEDKTFNGELLAGAAMSGVGFPIAAAEHVDLRTSTDIWVAWVIGFFAATVAMRSISEKGDRRNLQNRAFSWLGVLTGFGVFLWLTRFTAGVVPASPLLVVGWAVAGFRPTKHRERAAIALGAAAVATSAIIVYLSRTPP
jgi:hypothetical protein